MMVLNIVVIKDKKPKVANSPWLPTGHPPLPSPKLKFTSVLNDIFSSQIKL